MVLTAMLMWNIMGEGESVFEKPAEAVEIGGGTSARWATTRAHSTSGRACILRVEIESALPNVSPPSTAIVASMLAWQTKSNGRVVFEEGTPNLQFRQVATLPSNLPVGTAGLATLRTTAGDWINSVSNPNPPAGNFRCNYGRIRIYPAFNQLTTTSMRKAIIGHEIGHILGFGHPPAITTSIMKNDNSLRDEPQTYDRNELGSPLF